MVTLPADRNLPYCPVSSRTWPCDPWLAGFTDLRCTTWASQVPGGATAGGFLLPLIIRSSNLRGGDFRMPNARSLAAPAGCRTWLASRKKRRIAAAGVAIVAALAGSPMAELPRHLRARVKTVIVTATGLLSPATAVLRIGGTLLTQFHLINGVEAVIPAILEPVLDALPGITVTPDVSVNVQATPESTGPHTPSDVFLPQTGATRLAASGDTGQGVTVAVLDTGIDNLPDFSGRPHRRGRPDRREQPVPGQLRPRHVRRQPDRRRRRLVGRPVLGRSAWRQAGVDQGGGGERDDRPGHLSWASNGPSITRAATGSRSSTFLSGPAARPRSSTR